MATFYNEWMIENLTELAACNPEIAPYAKYLLDWVKIVNTTTDGWSSWSAGSKAGGKIAALIEFSLNGYKVTLAEWNRAIGAVKRAATAQAKYGNDIPVPTLG